MCAHPTLFLLSSNTRAAEAEAWANVQAEDLDAATTTKRKMIDLTKRIDIQYLFIFWNLKR